MHLENIDFATKDFIPCCMPLLIYYGPMVELLGLNSFSWYFKLKFGNNRLTKCNF